MPTIIRFSSSGLPGSRGGGPRRARTIALAVVALAAGALLLAFGLVLLAGLAAVGVVVGSGFAIYHKITGRWPGLPRGALHVERLEPTLDPTLDPAKQVFPPAAPRLPASNPERGQRGSKGGQGEA